MENMDEGTVLYGKLPWFCMGVHPILHNDTLLYGALLYCAVPRHPLAYAALAHICHKTTNASYNAKPHLPSRGSS